eukprot:gene5928-6614_t
MQKQKNSKNPGVWRKTGQPENAESQLGKHVKKTSSEDEGIHSVKQNQTESNVDYSAAENFFSSLSKPSEDSHNVAGRLPARDNASLYNNGNDQMGLGFQSKRNTFASSKDTNEQSNTRQDDRLPLINEATSNRHSKKGQELSKEYYDTKRLESTEIHSKEDAQRSKNRASITWNQGYKKPEERTGESWQGLKLPPMGEKATKTTSSKSTKVNARDGRNYYETGDMLAKAESNNLSNTLLPFTIMENENNATANAADRRLADVNLNALGESRTVLDYPQSYERRIGNANPSISDGFKSGRFEANKMNVGLKRLSVCSKLSAQELICYHNLKAEVMSMQALRFTNNYTFSFFDIPSSYEEQNKQVQSGVNQIGKRKVPKFSKPFKKTLKSQVKVAKTDN